MGKQPKKVVMNIAQRNKLIDFMHKHPQLVSGPLVDTDYSAQHCRTHWQTISRELNRVRNGTQKGWQKWRKTWHDMRSHAKRKVATSDEPLLEHEERIYNAGIELPPLIPLGQECNQIEGISENSNNQIKVLIVENDPPDDECPNVFDDDYDMQCNQTEGPTFGQVMIDPVDTHIVQDDPLRDEVLLELLENQESRQKNKEVGMSAYCQEMLKLEREKVQLLKDIKTILQNKLDPAKLQVERHNVKLLRNVKANLEELLG